MRGWTHSNGRWNCLNITIFYIARNNFLYRHCKLMIKSVHWKFIFCLSLAIWWVHSLSHLLLCLTLYLIFFVCYPFCSILTFFLLLSFQDRWFEIISVDRLSPSSSVLRRFFFLFLHSSGWDKRILRKTQSTTDEFKREAHYSMRGKQTYVILFLKRLTSHFISALLIQFEWKVFRKKSKSIKRCK